jgi:hypothetical protein
MTRRLASFPLALVATVVLAATALAGGWATASLDPGTTRPQAGTPITLGFRVLQHGQTPNSSLSVVVRASSAGGGSVAADATAKGEVGHYVATMTFPTDGAWTISWTSELDMAGSTAILDVTPAVAAPAAAAPVAAAPVISPTPTTTLAPADTLALAVVGIVLAVAVLGGLLALRRRRARTSVPSVS